MSDADIDTSDVPALDAAFFTRARLRMPAASDLVEVTLHLDPRVLRWFQQQGGDFELVVNAALRIYAESHISYGVPDRKSA